MKALNIKTTHCRLWALKLILFGIIFGATFSVHTSFAFAQLEDTTQYSPYTLQVPVPLGAGGGNLTEVTGPNGLGQYIQAWYNLLLIVTAIIAVVMIIVGGIRWAVAFGDSSKVNVAQETIREALIGLILMLLSITLLAFINPSLTTLGTIPVAAPQAIGTDQLTAGSTGSGTSTPPTADLQQIAANQNAAGCCSQPLSGLAGEYTCRFTRQGECQAPWAWVAGECPADLCGDRICQGQGQRCGLLANGENGTCCEQLNLSCTRQLTPQGRPINTCNYDGGTISSNWSYNSGIEAQKSFASPALTSIMNCMGNTLSGGVVTSIAVGAVANGSVSMADCAASGCDRSQCIHECGSCHFGGSTGSGQSHAFDMGISGISASSARAAAEACGGIFKDETSARFGPHYHISTPDCR